jgi:hypothetical protein
MTIVLSTLNARYAHASLGLRYLLANMEELQPQTRLVEFVIGTRTADLVEKLLAHAPRIIGFGVYIWNVEETTRLVAMLRRVAPDVKIILGGPEVSHETGDQPIIALADHVITGWGDISFAQLCRQIINGPQPLMKIHAGIQPPLAELRLPYTFYSDADRFLAELESLHARGARLFKFVDRTFNLNIKTSLKLMQFFLDKLAAHPEDPVYAHFEVVPDHLPDALKDAIARFPAGTLQFEIGIQSFNPEVQALVSRRQDNAKAAENIRWLHEHSHAHLHVDLIAGLPGEDVDSFARGFDHLVSLGPHEIQFGILKRLRGTPIIRHTDTYGLVFDPAPPYTILATSLIGFGDMQRLVRFARYWDLVANSGRFAHTLPLILGATPFARFMDLSDWLYEKTDATHRIALERLAALVTEWLVARGHAAQEVAEVMATDHAGQSGRLEKKAHVAQKKEADKAAAGQATQSALPQRQARHLAAS